MTNTTLNLPQAPVQPANSSPPPVRPSIRKGLRLSDLRQGDSALVTRLAFADPSCRRRFAELGLAEGMKLTVTATGDSLMLLLGIGGGTRMGIAARCADEVFVSRIKS